VWIPLTTLLFATIFGVMSGLLFAAFVLTEHHLFTAQPAKQPETEA
jgi:hypothetical protein